MVNHIFGRRSWWKKVWDVVMENVYSSRRSFESLKEFFFFENMWLQFPSYKKAKNSYPTYILFLMKHKNFILMGTSFFQFLSLEYSNQIRGVFHFALTTVPLSTCCESNEP